MPRNGAGTFSRSNGTYTGSNVWDQDAAADIAIESARHDTHDQDIADALTASLAKDGQTSPTASLPMAGFRHTNVGAATARTDYARASQCQDGAFSFGGTSGGSLSAYTLTLTPAPAAYVAGMLVSFIANHTNTGAATLNLNGVGAIAIRFGSGATALPAGAIQNGGVVTVMHNGTYWMLLSSHVLIEGLLAADLKFEGTRTITANTTDGADNQAIGVFGGGSNSSARGGGISIYGNEHASTGKVEIEAGTVTNGTINLKTGNQLRVYLDETGTLNVDSTNGGDIAFLRAGKGVDDHVNAAVTAAGANQGAATALTSRVNQVTTASSGQGVRLPTPARAGGRFFVRNSSGNPIKLYPASGGQIENLGTNVGMDIQSGDWVELLAITTTLWLKVSTL